ncbi:histidinol-phosphate transaminase [Pseudolactococcus yaeyamensis]
MTEVRIKQTLAAYESKYVKRELPVLTQKQELIQLDRNENNYGPSSQVATAILDELSNLSQYTDVEAQPLRRALAQYFDLENDQILVTNGSFDLISLIASVYQNAGHTALTCAPTFDWYRVATVVNGGDLLELPLTAAHGFDLEAIRQAITPQTDIIWICNPNNPTGTFLAHQELETFLAQVPKNILVVLDEAYIEYANSHDASDSLKFIKTYPNVILLRTFSKVHGLASLRIGYGMANPQIIHQLFGLKVPPNMNRLSLQAATASLADIEHTQKIIALNAGQRANFYKVLAKHGLEVIPSQTNFILVNFKTETAPIVAALKAKGILVRGGAEYGYPNWIRLTIGKAEENDAFFRQLNRLSSQNMF